MKLDKKIFVLIAILGGLIISTWALGQEGQSEEAVPEDSAPAVEGSRESQPPPRLGQQQMPQAKPQQGSLERVTPPAAKPQETAVEVTTVKSDITAPLSEEEKVYLNVHDADIKDVIKQISKATGRNFIIDDKIRGKVTIISERPMTREEAYQTFLSALEVAGYTTVKGPANVIKVVPLKEAAQSPIPIHVDSTPYTDSFVTRLIPLANISALDMSNAIKDLVSKSGNLFAYPSTNTLIITDSGSNIDRIMKLVKELDQEGPQQVMEIIPIRNALAADIAAMVQNLFEKGKDGGGAAGAKRRVAGQPEELEEVSKIIPDERTNSIIVLASKRAIDKVREIIAKLDSRLSATDEGRIHVYYLKHAKAKDMAETLSALTSSAATAAKGSKGGEIAVAKFEGGVKIAADNTTNSLIITALPKDFQTLVDKVISKLDIPRRQVYFEAVVMEMTLSKGLDYGVSGYAGARSGGAIGFGQTLGAPSLLGGILGQTASQGTNAWPALLGGLVSSRTTDITYVGADGASKTLTVPAFSAFLTALANRGEANVVSTPNLLTLDNEEATMQVLSKEPIPGSTTFGASGISTTPSVDYKEAGLELKIKPQITEGDMVLLEIEQKLSGFSTPKFSTNINAPAMKERKVKTTVVTENGQTVVLAGLMDDTASKNKRKIPLLGDIPILGVLFSTTSESMSKSNLLIFITPHIIKNRTDFTEIIKRKIEERNKFIDENFSKSRRRQIKDTIKTHREDLLEFKQPEEIEAVTPQLPVKGKNIVIEKGAPAPHRPPVVPVAAPPPAKEVKPVITVPKDEITSRGPAVPSTPAIESSAWKPVIPPPVPAKPAALPEAPIVEKKIEEKKVEEKVALPPLPQEKPVASKKEVAPLPMPAAPEPAAPVAPKKEYKKPVLPLPAFEDETPGPQAKVAPWVPAPAASAAVKEPKPAAKKAEPVITAPREEAAPAKGGKTWKKPTVGTSGEMDLTY